MNALGWVSFVIMNIFGGPTVDHAAQHEALLPLISDPALLQPALAKPNVATLNFVPSSPQQQPLLIAAASGDYAESASLLLAAKCDVDIAESTTGATACFAAAQADAKAALSVLILSNADVNLAPELDR